MGSTSSVIRTESTFNSKKNGYICISSKSTEFVSKSVQTDITLEDASIIQWVDPEPKKATSIGDVWLSVEETVDVRKGDGEKMDLTVRRSGWKTIRVFVSSTFRDFMYEREVLCKEIFPDLRAWCESRRLHLVECDLRWGVPKDSTSEITLRTCLGEIDRCYADNVMPFFLNMTSERIGWIPDPADIPDSLVQEYKWIFGLSVTEMEIIHGAFRKDNPNSLFLMRDDTFLDSVPADYKCFFVEENPLTPSKVKMLKQMISNRFPSERIINYKSEFDYIDKIRDLPVMNLEHTFRDAVFKFFKEKIESQYPLIEEAKADIYHNQKEAMEAFMKQRSQIVLGRAMIINQLKVFVSDKLTNRPLILLGGAGSGKTSIIARCIDDLIPTCVADGRYVFYNFVGAVPGSTSLELSLKRFLLEVGAVNHQTMPADIEATCQMVAGVLSNNNTKKTVIVFDAVNQFDEDKFSARLSWLPSNLSKNVKVIMSMINDSQPHNVLKEQHQKSTELYVDALGLQVRKDIIKEILGEYNKRLDLDQMINLLSKENSINPLWLSLACEELRVFGDYIKINHKIESLADTLPDLLSQILGRFELENGGFLIVATLSLLEVANHGLKESELLVLLADEDNLMPPIQDKEKGQKDSIKKEKQPYKEQLPAFKWAQVYRALRKFLRPFGSSGEGRLDFYHRSLSKAVRKKYFKVSTENNDGDEKVYKWWREKLCHYFSTVPDIARKIEEYPYQLMALKKEDELLTFLCDWSSINQLYHNDFSAQLFNLWKPIGGKERMCEVYMANMENINCDTSVEEVLMHYHQITNLLIQQDLLKDAESMLDCYQKFLVDSKLKDDLVYKAEFYWTSILLWDNRQKSFEFILKSQLPVMKQVVTECDNLLQVLEKLDTPRYQFLKGKAHLIKGFTMSGIDNCTGNPDNVQIGLTSVEIARKIFSELKNEGLLAEAIMIAAILHFGTTKQLDLYNEAMEKSLLVYGENSLLTCRIYINRGIYYEEQADYNTAHDHFYNHWKIMCELYGGDHARSKKAKKILDEPMYKRLSQEKGIEFSQD